MVYKFFEKKTRSRAKVNQELAKELQKPVMKTFKRTRIMQDLKIKFGRQI